jgi:hypothetical protein
MHDAIKKELMDICVTMNGDLKQKGWKKLWYCSQVLQLNFHTVNESKTFK